MFDKRASFLHGDLGMCFCLLHYFIVASNSKDNENVYFEFDDEFDDGIDQNNEKNADSEQGYHVIPLTLIT